MVAVDYLHERCGLIHSLSPKKAISFAWLCMLDGIIWQGSAPCHSLALELSSKHGVSTPCNVIRHQPSSSIKSSDLDRNSCRAKFEHIHLLDRSKSVNLSYEGSEKMATCTSQAKISSDVGKPREPGRKSIGANAGVRRLGLH